MPDTIESLIRQAIQTLTVPAAEYVPAIPDAWAILERAAALATQPLSPPAQVGTEASVPEGELRDELECMLTGLQQWIMLTNSSQEEILQRLEAALDTLLSAAPVAAVGEAAARVLDVDEHETVDVGFIDWVGGKALKQGTLLRGLQGNGIHWRLYLETVRAIEAAHGIRGEHV